MLAEFLLERLVVLQHSKPKKSLAGPKRVPIPKLSRIGFAAHTLRNAGMLEDSVGSPQETRRIRREVAEQRVCMLTALFSGEERRVAGGGALALFAAS